MTRGLVIVWEITGFTRDSTLEFLVISCVIFGRMWARFSICNKERAARVDTEPAFPVQIKNLQTNVLNHLLVFHFFSCLKVKPSLNLGA